ncbi:hypothetical protein ACIPPS_05880 [Streptomyces sp. NPDC090127]|uniref:hypothetical protein n=1 Tax=Streptomyces sp. NPDC090127 TaxID=3365953 RepID=UPI0037FB31AF
MVLRRTGALRPTTTSMRGRCECGWRGGNTYPIDWEQVRDHGPDGYDTAAPQEDWNAHTDQVAPVRSPCLSTLHASSSNCARLSELVNDEPLAALRTVGDLEATAAWAGPYATRRIIVAATPDSRVAEALGPTEKVARSRLARYAFLH